ncbi:MAG: peptidoglycan-associated lipoprotein Pal [Desulfomonilia bacterium]
MRNGERLVGLIAILALIFFVTGCAKKGIGQVEETTPPAQEKPVTEAPDMDFDMPETEGDVSEVPLALEEEMAKFEQNMIFFDFDKYSLSADARRVLAEKASFLNEHPNLNVRIEGHCDERGTREYNLALGERRAKSAQDYLVFLGINPERISIVSYGEERPLEPGSGEAAWAKNRRAEFRILGN